MIFFLFTWMSFYFFSKWVVFFFSSIMFFSSNLSLICLDCSYLFNLSDYSSYLFQNSISLTSVTKSFAAQVNPIFLICQEVHYLVGDE
jgi:hypothetical protein